MRLVLILLFIYSSANAQTSGGYTPPSGGSNINVSDSAWGLIGNSNTNNATNFIGTTNNVGLSFRTNNIIRQTIDNNGFVGIGTTTPATDVHLVRDMNAELRVESTGTTPTYDAIVSVINGTTRTVLSSFDAGDLGFVGTESNDDFGIITNGINRIIFKYSGNIGVGTINPTSIFEINGSQASSVTNITATTTLNQTHNKILVSNGATNITITLPNALTCLGREYVFSRAAGSTGSITIVGGAGNKMQALNGAVGATTSIGLHSATGGGLRHSFTAVNIGGVGVWVRL